MPWTRLTYRSPGPDGVASETHIDPKGIATLTAIVSLIGGLATTIIAVVNAFARDIPASRAQDQRLEREGRLLAIAQALQPNTAVERANSIKLLMAADFFGKDSAAIKRLISETTMALPQWPRVLGKVGGSTVESGPNRGGDTAPNNSGKPPRPGG